MLWWARTDGSSQPQLLYQVKGSDAVPGSISPDGRYLALHQPAAATSRDINVVPLDTADPEHPKAGTPQLFVATAGADVDAAFSPDGRWLAYSSSASESGVFHVFVRPFPAGVKAGGQVQVSTADGRSPIWSRSAKELFYVTGDGHIMVVSYTDIRRGFPAGQAARVVPGGSFVHRNWRTTRPRAGWQALRRFSAAADSNGNLHLTFLLNFFDGLKRRVPVR